VEFDTGDVDIGEFDTGEFDTGEFLANLSRNSMLG
jgi:hypothetical protein